MGKLFEDQVKQNKDFEVVTPRSLALVVFRLKPADKALNEDALNELNKKFYARLHKHTSIQLSKHEAVAHSDSMKLLLTAFNAASTIIGKTFCIRFVPGSPWTRSEHILAAWRVIQETAQEELRK